MSLITLNNDNLFLELSPEMGASITKFRDIKSSKDIFRPFSSSKKLNKKNMKSIQRLTILGAGTPTPTKDRFGSSIVVEVNGDLVMFDCGPATTHKLTKAGISTTKVDYLFFSHHHFDHDVDYPCFLLTRWDQGAGKEETLKVFGPNLTEEFTENLIGNEGVFSHDWKARVNHPVSQQV